VQGKSLGDCNLAWAGAAAFNLKFPVSQQVAMKITPRNGNFGSYLYDESGKTVFHMDARMVCVVGKDNVRRPTTWWFYQDKYKNSSIHSYGNIVFVEEFIRVTIT
jgi:hypothetical protein